MTFNNTNLATKVKVKFFHSYNITVIDFNFGRHKDLSTFKSDIHLGRVDKSNVYRIEVNICTLLKSSSASFMNMCAFYR